MDKITLRTRFARASMVGLTGLTVAIAITQFDRHFQGDWGFVRCAAGGAFLAGLMFARSFGGQGAWGMFCAGMGFGASTVLGAIFAVLLMPFEQMLAQIIPTQISLLGESVEIAGLLGASLLGPLYVLTTVADHTQVLLAWIMMLMGLHGASRMLGTDA